MAVTKIRERSETLAEELPESQVNSAALGRKEKVE